MTATPRLQMRQLTKSFEGVDALTDVTFEVGSGEVHAVCGENGAGKSTLIKILTGVLHPDRGSVLLDGRPLTLGRVAVAEAAGIAAIHQESPIFPDLNAVDNLFVGRELTRGRGLFLDCAAMRGQAAERFAQLGEAIDLGRPVGQLPLAQRQMVAVARALQRQCRLLIMDEPTASLSARETRVLLQVVRQLRRDGVSVLYVSHRLEEVFEIADRVTVLRDGALVATTPTGELTSGQLIQQMVGREIAELGCRHERANGFGPVRLQVNDLSRSNAFAGVTLNVHAGEIVALAGLVVRDVRKSRDAFLASTNTTRVMSGSTGSVVHRVRPRPRWPRGWRWCPRIVSNKV